MQLTSIGLLDKSPPTFFDIGESLARQVQLSPNAADFRGFFLAERRKPSGSSHV